LHDDYSSFVAILLVDLRGDPRLGQILPAATWYFLMYMCFVFALVERKNETQKKMQYRSAEGKKRLRKSYY
jgi:hypothetical protein